VTALEDVARDAGCRTIWVAAPDGDADFYRHCSWTDDVHLDAGGHAADHGSLTVLAKELTPGLTTAS
jgi:hypothetical protein